MDFTDEGFSALLKFGQFGNFTVKVPWSALCSVQSRATGTIVAWETSLPTDKMVGVPEPVSERRGLRLVKDDVD